MKTRQSRSRAPSNSQRKMHMTALSVQKPCSEIVVELLRGTQFLCARVAIKRGVIHFSLIAEVRFESAADSPIFVSFAALRRGDVLRLSGDGDASALGIFEQGDFNQSRNGSPLGISKLAR